MLENMCFELALTVLFSIYLHTNACHRIALHKIQCNKHFKLAYKYVILHLHKQWDSTYSTYIYITCQFHEALRLSKFIFRLASVVAVLLLLDRNHAKGLTKKTNRFLWLNHISLLSRKKNSPKIVKPNG